MIFWIELLPEFINVSYLFLFSGGNYMEQKKSIVTKKVKILAFLKKLYEEKYLDNDTYIQALNLVKECKE